MKRKLFCVPLFTLLFFSFCNAQSYKYIYNFDDLLNPTTPDKATIIARGSVDSETFKIDYFSANNNIPYISAHYADSSLKQLQGEFTAYHPNGKIQKQGNYIQDQKQGFWQTCDTLGLKRTGSFYKDDKLLIEEKFNYFRDETLCFYSLKDFVTDTLKTITYNENGQVIREVFFKGDKGESKQYEGFKTITSLLTTRDLTEAFFPGGVDGWINYLMNNLNAAIPIDKGAPRGLYQVMVQFLVSPEGKISNVIAETQLGYGMEKEVIRIIKSCPDWMPAVQYGRRVTAYRRQPVTFSVGQR